MSVESAELQAWLWLLKLERLDWRQFNRQHTDAQVSIRAIPGALGALQGAPMVRVSVSVPGVGGGKTRLRAIGNSLAGAVWDLHGKLWRAGVQLPNPFVGAPREAGEERSGG
jgi:hypothetical protein